MARIYSDAEADLQGLKEKQVALIGYGSQGQAQALNLRDGGIQVILGLRPGRSWERASADGFEVYPVAEAVQRAEIVVLLVNDEAQPSVYEGSIRPALRPGMALAFAHGFNIHFGQILPPPELDVFLVAPMGVGPLVRRLFTEGKGVPCLVAVHQDYTGNALCLALAYAKALGGTRAGVIESSFKEECETDLFGEQAVICGGVSALVKAGFETLVEAGYQPEVAYFACLHELKFIADLIHESGIFGMRSAISNTAQYGDMTRGPRLINEAVKEEMRKILREIQRGEFAREWVLENKLNRPVFNALANADADHLIERVGRELRKRMGVSR